MLTHTSSQGEKESGKCVPRSSVPMKYEDSSKLCRCLESASKFRLSLQSISVIVAAQKSFSDLC
jgi:hypothetical protein